MFPATSVLAKIELTRRFESALEKKFSPLVKEKLDTIENILFMGALLGNGLDVVSCPDQCAPAGKFAHGPVPQGGVKSLTERLLPV